MSKVVKYAPEWYALEEKLLQSFREAVATGDYRWERAITPNVKLGSIYYSNGNRRVYLTALNSKVDKVAEKQLSTEDYTTAEKTKLSGLSNYTHPNSGVAAGTYSKVTVITLGHITDGAS